MQSAMDVVADYLQVIYEGAFDHHEALSQVPLILRTCEQFRLAKVLIDFSRLDGYMLKTYEVFFALKLCEIFLTEFSAAGRKLAIAFISKQGAMNCQSTVELMRRAGIDAFVTEDEASAKSWLYQVGVPN